MSNQRQHSNMFDQYKPVADAGAAVSVGVAAATHYNLITSLQEAALVVAILSGLAAFVVHAIGIIKYIRGKQ